MTGKIKNIVSVLCLVAFLFSAALLPASAYGENLRFVFLADSRSDTKPTDPTNLAPAINTPVLNAIIAQIQALSPPALFVVYGGDQAYRGCFTFSNTPYYTFQTFKDLFTNAGITLYTAIGNHELYVDGQDGFFLANQQQYQQVFPNIPSNPLPGYEGLAYSFESPGGDAFFAVLDPYFLTGNVTNPNITGTFFDNNQNTPQLTWLTAQVAQTQATHKFLFTHGPYYYVTPFNPPPPPYPPDLSYTTLWSLLDSNRFDIFFCGHTHLYSRKTIDSSIAPNPPSPGVHWQNKVVQLLCGTCGAPVDTGTLTVDSTLWHVSQATNT